MNAPRDLLPAACLLLLPATAAAQSSGIHTYCNPLDIDYRYNWEQSAESRSYRSGADPVIVSHNREYYLFVTISQGWWHSRDLIHWDYVAPDKWPVEDNCAPAALSVRDTLYLFQSSFAPRPIVCTTNPATGHLAFFNPLMSPLRGALGPWDPAVFHDGDTDRWYMYFGSSNLYPIYGIELDHARGLDYRGQARPLISLRPELHGWERFGQDHRDTTRPYVEGAWMTKHNGTYYLQYAAPGTEYNVYANGVYLGPGPLGPFIYAPYNPVSYKPGGCWTGAGHGNTFQDTCGNYWNTGTPWIGVNWNFERRIAMFPAGFDSAGQMFVNTRFGDFPHAIPDRRWRQKDELFTGWMLLSYRKPCTSSSVHDTFHVANVTDENPRTFWVAGSGRKQSWATIDLEQECTLRALQVNFADYRSGIFGPDPSVRTQFTVSASLDGVRWQVVADLSDEQHDRPNAYVELTRPVTARYVRYDHIFVAAAYLAISDIRVFGRGGGDPPPPPSGLAVRRDADPRNAFITWDPLPGAVGYNVLWGIRTGALYSTYQTFADRAPSLELRALTVGQHYYVALEAFNENGVSPPTGVVFLR